MVKVYAAMVGSFPRPRGLARLISRFNSGKIGYEALELGYGKYTKRLFKLLITAKINSFTDGMLRWDDIFNPLISYIEGVKVNGLYRFYENNFFFRTPQIIGRLGLRTDCPIPEWYEKSKKMLDEVAGDSSSYTLKAVLPGPLTFALNSINEYYSSVEDLIREYTYEVLHPLMKGLKEKGARIVEVHEPELTYGRGDVRVKLLGVELLSKLATELGIKLWLQTYFGDACDALDYFFYLSKHIVGIDLIATNEYSRCLRYFSEFDSLAVGIYDSRNTLIERNRSVGWYVSRFAKLPINEIYVTNNAPMDFLPESVAVKKLRKLGKFTYLFNARGVR